MYSRAAQMSTPSQDAYIDVSDYSSVEEVAEEMMRIANDKQAFESKLAWKKRGELMANACLEIRLSSIDVRYLNTKHSQHCFLELSKNLITHTMIDALSH